MSTDSVNNGTGNCIQKSPLGWQMAAEQNSTPNSSFIIHIKQYYYFLMKLW